MSRLDKLAGKFFDALNFLSNQADAFYYRRFPKWLRFMLHPFRVAGIICMSLALYAVLAPLAWLAQSWEDFE
jgi:hypothetical protein